MLVEKVSVIIPAYNSEATIARCLAGLHNQSYEGPYEIIVVDDGSTDDTAREAQAAGVTVISIPRSRPAAARNTGIHRASGDLICFTDADCTPHPDWIRQITAPFSDEATVACKGVYTTTQTEMVARFVQLEYEDKYDLLRTQDSIDFIDTYSAAYRREVLLDNGGFDEWFQYLEDQELSFRLAARGYRMVFQELAVVEHIHSAGVWPYLRKKFLIGYWKAQVIRRFPGQVVKDSHTPQVMKIQMVLVALLLMTLLLGLFNYLFDMIRFGSFGWLAFVSAGLVTVAFFLTTLPFVIKAWPKDREVAVVSPFLLAIRALGLSSGYFWGIVHPHPRIRETSGFSGLNYLAKRLLDLVIAIPGLLFTLLTWPLWAVIIKLDTEGPVLFQQERIGEHGRSFTLYKFRSMRRGAEEAWSELVMTLGLSEPVLKLDTDPRLTRAGRFMRRWSLDEMPQFWNVIKGEMSLVGPRPDEPRVVAYYSEWHRRRLAVKPGITGLMQISGRADLTLDERVKFDLDYIDGFSLRRDLTILVRTIPVVLRGRGAR
jgi:lipopolysaccharide/colanic/teichoic acid biosynthesis glycosyltransferase/glycosyltransferase involved in cell wall biosynthesis